MTDRYFFVHVQKTAGTSLWRRLRRAFPHEALYPGPDDGDPPTTTISIDHLSEIWSRRSDEIRVVTGHFPLCTTELLGGGFTTLTVVREPVERTLSFLRHYRNLTPAAANLTLEEIYDDPERRKLFHNHMTKMFALTAEEMTDGALTDMAFTRDRLEAAKHNLTTVDVVGIQPRFEDFCSELVRRFDWALGKPVVANRTDPEPTSTHFRERIRHENALDAELYEFACSIAV